MLKHYSLRTWDFWIQTQRNVLTCKGFMVNISAQRCNIFYKWRIIWYYKKTDVRKWVKLLWTCEKQGVCVKLMEILLWQKMDIPLFYEDILFKHSECKCCPADVQNCDFFFLNDADFIVTYWNRSNKILIRKAAKKSKDFWSLSFMLRDPAI